MRVFLTVTLPLSGPGIVAGLTTAFAWTFSAFATPQLVGGGKVNMVSNLVYQLGFANFNFPFAAALCVAGLALTYVSIFADADHVAAARKSRAALMARPISHRLMSFAGRALVVAILGFIILPAFVVAIASFNDKAMLSFPPQQLSLRWFYNAINYRDFQTGFYNGLIVMLASSFLALVVGAAFAYVIDRYQFRGKDVIEGLLLAPLVVPHFTVGLGMLILAAQIGAARTFRVVIVCHVILVLPFVLRSVYISLRNLDQRLELAAASLGAQPAPRALHRDAAAAAAGPRQRLAVRRDPVLQRIHRLAVRHRAAHADAAGRDV